MKSSLRHCVIAWSTVAVIAAGPVRAATIDAVEYYNAALDHYFVTARADEIAKLDAGLFVGWQRTNQTFKVFDPAAPVAGASPVCRFYGIPEAGLDSHFYSASLDECADVRLIFAGIWREESDHAFGVWLPDPQTGRCPAMSVPVYRSWNQRADSNHRFTTDPVVQQTMIARGYRAEGYGPEPMPVAMCAPSEGPAPGTVPACVVSATDTTPNVGATIVLTASCSNAPTTFTWSGCTSSAATCNATSAAIGQVAYTVVARNAAGASAPAGVSVTWETASTAVPKCTLSRTAQTDPPVVNGLVVLTIACDRNVGSYSWSGCSSTNDVCIAREFSPGTRTYSVFARNASGSSAPVSVTLGWVASPAPAPGLCGQFPSYLWSDIGSQGGRVESAALITPPGFAWNGAWAVRFVVPSTIGSRLGRLSTAEFAGEPTVREATISRTPCDFRATDPTGVNGPFSRGSGISVTSRFTADPAQPGYPVLQPGATYYYNVRNWQPATGTISCSPSPGRCDAFVEALLPR